MLMNYIFKSYYTLYKIILRGTKLMIYTFGCVCISPIFFLLFSNKKVLKINAYTTLKEEQTWLNLI